jgi:hypothetical protein
MDDILAVAARIGLNTTKARNMAERIRDCVFDMFRDYVKYSK